MLYDLVPAIGGAPSMLPGASALSGSSPATGSAVNCDLLEGQIFGEFQCGNAANSPTSYAVTCKLTECDTSGGSYTDIAQQSAGVLSADGTRVMIRAQRTKRYVKAVATPAFVGGSSPSLAVTGSVLGVLRRVNNLQT
jgi:hypothetical protein